MNPYWTVIVPPVPVQYRTSWHPTERFGPFAVLSRGAFPTEAEAIEWGQKHLNGTPYTVRQVTE